MPTARSRATFLFLSTLCVCFALLSAPAQAQDPVNTRMLADPAVSADHIAFVYAGDLWMAGRDGSAARRITTHPGTSPRPASALTGGGWPSVVSTMATRMCLWSQVEGGAPRRQTGSGELIRDAESVPGGLLGADYEVANGRYRFRKVYGGMNWSPDLRAPDNLYARFENSAGKQVEITVGPNPDGTGSRTVTVVPVRSENSMRNREWVENNVRKVHEATRYGSDLSTPSAAIQGPKVMLIDEYAGSGGDFLPWMFREFDLGTLIGRRAWGGVGRHSPDSGADRWGRSHGAQYRLLDNRRKGSASRMSASRPILK